MIKITIEEIIEILDVDVINCINKREYICGVSIDSRSVQKNNLFVPIKGLTVDGHMYIDDAIESGISATLWDKNTTNPPQNIPVILVNDTLEAMQKLAKEYRNRLKAKIVGITGSNGKTSTKDITAGILSYKYKTQKTLGNYNTEIGVPYTLLSLEEDCEVAVIEMGMEKKGEIDFLTKLVNPDIGIVTSVALVHIDNFPNIDEIAKTKMEIVSGIKEEGVFIYYGDSHLLQDTVSKTKIREDIKVYTFGEKERNTIWFKNFEQDIEGIHFEINDEGFAKLHTNMLGKHQALNSLAAILTAKELGMNAQEIEKGFINIEKTGLRNEIIKIDKCRILNDCYKSNPVSIMSALDIFEILEERKKIVVLGDMFGYRDLSEEIHYEVGKNLSNYKIDELITIGQDAKHIAIGARENTKIKNIIEFDTKEDATQYVQKYIKEDAAILIKGSRFLKLEYIVNKLKEKNGEKYEKN